MQSRIHTLLLFALTFVFAGISTTARADEVTDWNQILFQAALVAQTTPLIITRNAAIVQASVFDAVNGIERRFTPIHVKPDAPHGASARAAAVQAAYVSLVNLYPTQKSTFDAARATSLAAILNKGGDDKKGDGDGQQKRKQAVDRGVAWGQEVADAIWTWRSTDGFTPPPPPFTGGTNIGEWRPTPPAFAPGAGPQFAYMTSWVIVTPSQFRPAGSPALNSARYAEVFNETKSFGSVSSRLRTADQTLFSQFWNSSTTVYSWNRVALYLGAERHMTLLQNALVLGALDVAMADAAIACWEAKYHYVFWRPVTAIPLADSDGNPATISDPNWTPLLITPAHPEYPSGHSTTSAAGATVLAHYFGKNSSFTVDSDVMLGVVRSFPNFAAALAEVNNARVYGGIHFRTACEDGQVTGTAVANFVLKNAFQRVDGNEREDWEDDND
jgi:membrane-associated phospholipid phosphatase